MMKDNVARIVKLSVLVPLFVVVATLWIPFMILVRLWKASANDVNEFFTPSPKRSNVVSMRRPS